MKTISTPATAVTSHFERGDYGELINADTASAKVGLKILAIAHKKGLLPGTYDCTEWNKRKGRREGEMLNEDVYDVAPGAVLVQQRHVDMHKYGTTVTKNYFLITRKDGKITVENRACDKPRIMKLAKSDLPLGGVIAAITGKKPAKIKISK